MIVHIFNKETVYSYKFLLLLYDYFDLKSNHIFVFRSPQKNSKYDYPSDIKEQIVHAENWYKFIIRLFIPLIKADKIILHYLAVGPSLFFWFIFRALIKKVIWKQWGNDLYYFQKKKKFPDTLYEYLRKVIIKRIDAIVCIPKEDYELTKKVYETEAKYFYAFYPNPIGYESIEYTPYDLRDKQTLNILIGNSANPTNNHLEILKALGRIQMENSYKIYCPLSYGGDKDYVNEVIHKGKNLFGENFVYITKLKSPQHYKDFLLKMDIAIMNQRRKQGMGTVFFLLYSGKKVYIRSDVTSYTYLKELGLTIFKTDEIIEGFSKSINYFPQYLQTKNHEIIKNEFSFEQSASLWKKIFDY